MSTVAEFIALVSLRGSDAVFHRADSLVPCPCRTPEGYRDPEWHKLWPNAMMCDETGHLADPTHSTEIAVKAFVQPIQSTRATRLSTEQLIQMFGEIQADDHLGIFPESWGGVALNFYEWSLSGEDYVLYDGRKYVTVNSNLIPDPSDGNPRHHWEVGLRLITPEALT